MSIVYIQMETTEADLNLAAEQYVFDRLDADREYFMLWRNKSAVIVGKFQNTYAEVNAGYVKEHGISVVRRLSGGGAVYHDMGNLNYTCIGKARGEGLGDIGYYSRAVVEVLAELGIKAELSGRNDISVAGKKISGCAQYALNGRIMHHGTLLFDSDLDVLEAALNVDGEKIRTKGIRSVKSRVRNIRPLLKEDMDIKAFENMLLKRTLTGTEGERYSFSPQDMREIEKLRRERYSSWAWNYGASPACSLVKKRRGERYGTVEAHIGLESGKIDKLFFYGDYFSPQGTAELEDKLRGAELRAEEIAKRLDQDTERFISGMTRDELLALLSG